MCKVIPHRERYLVQYWGWARRDWIIDSTHKKLVKALSVAKHKEELGYFEYRVVDTQED